MPEQVIDQQQQPQDNSLLSPQEMWDKLDRTADTEEQWLDGKASYLRQRMVGIDDIQRRIGVGVQYVVYEVPGERVFKVPQTPMSAGNEYLRQGGDAAEVEEIIRLREESASYVEKLTSDFPKTASLFGNPWFNGEQGSARAFEQDKLTLINPLAFNELPFQAQVDYISDYINLVKCMWLNGCSEKSMNFQVNTGLNRNNQVVAVDFGEMDITKESVLASIQERKWEYAWGLRTLKEDVRAAAVGMFDRELTETALENLWTVSLIGHEFNKSL